MNKKAVKQEMIRFSETQVIKPCSLLSNECVSRFPLKRYDNNLINGIKANTPNGNRYNNPVIGSA
jgi:hypothetical protein